MSFMRKRGVTQVTHSAQRSKHCVLHAPHTHTCIDSTRCCHAFWLSWGSGLPVNASTLLRAPSSSGSLGLEWLGSFFKSFKHSFQEAAKADAMLVEVACCLVVCITVHRKRTEQQRRRRWRVRKRKVVRDPRLNSHNAFSVAHKCHQTHLGVCSTAFHELLLLAGRTSLCCGTTLARSPCCRCCQARCCCVLCAVPRPNEGGSRA